MAGPLTDFLTVVRAALRDSAATYEFTDGELSAYITECLKELSLYCPYKEVEVKVVSNSKVLDVSDITNLVHGVLSIEKAEYPVGSSPRNYRNVKIIDEGTIELVVDTKPAAGSSGKLTGTVTFTTGSTTITGVGTAFTTELAAGYLIKKSSGTRCYPVYSIESNTSLTLTEPCRSADNGADTENATVYYKGAVFLYCNKLHELTDTVGEVEGVSTLTEELEQILVKGVCAKAAMAFCFDKGNAVNVGGAGVPDRALAYARDQKTHWLTELKQLRGTIVRRRYPSD